MQLNLFQWDLIEVGNGFSCLAGLAFDQAEPHFVRVLGGLPDHPAATAGLQATRHWRQALLQMEEGRDEAAFSRFWQRIRNFSFTANEVGGALRSTLIRVLRERMEQAGVRFIEPDLCTGYLSFLLGEYVTAEKELRRLIDTFPDRGLLYGYLADTLWQQGRREIANGVYVAALLLAPHEMAAHAVCNRELASVMKKHGAEMAPVHGFFLGVLPLVEPESAANTEAARIYAILHRAERARRRQNFSTMAAARRELQHQAPDIFRQYLDWLRSGGDTLPAPRQVG